MKTTVSQAVAGTRVLLVSLLGAARPEPPPLFQASQVRREDLRAADIDPAQVLEGKPVARSMSLTASADDKFTSNVWDCTAGKFRWTYHSDEMIYILEGEVTVESEGTEARTLRPGDVALFPKGLTSVWHVPQYVKKLAVHRSFDVGLGRRIERRIAKLWR